MLKVGDKVRVKSSGAIGAVQELRDNEEEVYVEFDGCAGTRTGFRLSQLDLVRATEDPNAAVEIIQADKDL